MFTIHRDNHKSGYTYVSNTLMHDRRLSLNARGLMMIVLSLPEKWEFTISGLAVMCGISQDAVNRCIKELCALGYAEVRQSKDGKGRFSQKDYLFYETPEGSVPLTEKPVTDNPVTDNPVTDNPVTDEPVTEKPEQSNNNTYKDNKSNKDTKKPAGEKMAEYQRIIDLFNSVCVSLPRVLELNPQRYHLLEQASKSITDFGELFIRTERSDFLTGRSGKWDGCCFDWLLKPENLLKLREGKYDNKKAPPIKERDYTKALTNADRAAEDGFLF